MYFGPVLHYHTLGVIGVGRPSEYMRLPKRSELSDHAIHNDSSADDVTALLSVASDVVFRLQGDQRAKLYACIADPIFLLKCGKQSLANYKTRKFLCPIENR